MARVDEGSPRGSLLSPVLWLIYLTRTLNQVETHIPEITASGTNMRTLFFGG